MTGASSLLLVGGATAVGSDLLGGSTPAPHSFWNVGHPEVMSSFNPSVGAKSPCIESTECPALKRVFCSIAPRMPSTTVVDSDNLNLLWALILRFSRWRSDYGVGSVSCCGRTTA